MSTTQAAQPDPGDCPVCQGDGTVRVETSHLGPDDYEYDEECAACQGTGSADIRDAIKALPYQLNTAKPHTEMVSRSLVLQVIEAHAALASAGGAGCASAQHKAEAGAAMTAGRAQFFMERFLHEEKMLGPNEQAALHYVIAMLEAAHPPAPEQPAPEYWQDAVFTLMGHAEGLRAEGKTEMPAWCYSLAEQIARTHLDSANADRVRAVAAQRATPTPREGE